MLKFTKEQWQEIGKARSKLEAFINKVQTYPAYPAVEEQKPQVVETVVRHITYNAEFTKKQWTEIYILNNRVKALENGKMDKV